MTFLTELYGFGFAVLWFFAMAGTFLAVGTLSLKRILLCAGTMVFALFMTWMCGVLLRPWLALLMTVATVPVSALIWLAAWKIKTLMVKGVSS